MQGAPRLAVCWLVAGAVACKNDAGAAPPSAAPVPSAAPAPAASASAAPAAVSTPSRQKKKTYVVAALGDSLTDPKSHGGGYLKGLAEKCPKSRFVSFGKGGDMVNQMRRRFEDEIFGGSAGAAGYTHLIVFGGVNDVYSDLSAGRTVDKITRDLKGIYGLAHVHGVSVVGVTVTPWGGFKKYFNETRAASTHGLNAWILAQRGTTAEFAVDAFPLLSCGEPEFLCAEYAKPFKDGLHFGPEGHRKLADALYREVFADCE